MKKSKKRVIPGIRTDNGCDDHDAEYHSPDSMLASLVVYSSQLGLKEFFEVITRKRSIVQLLRKFYHSTWCITGQRCDGTDSCLGAGAL